MTDIIKVELFRIKKSVLFWVMFGLSAVSPLLTVLLNMVLYSFMGIETGASANLLETMRSAGITSGLMQEMTLIYNDVTLFAIIATAVILSKEFVDGTMRNVVLANKSRAELYFAYLITSMIIALSYMTAFFAVTLIVVAPIFGFQDAAAGKVVSAIFCSYGLGILAAAFIETCVCMFIFGVRKQWAAILFPILIWYAPMALTQIINIVIMSIAESGQLPSLDFIRWLPFCNMQEYNPINPDGTVIGMNILYMAVFIAGFICIGHFTFKKADLK